DARAQGGELGVELREARLVLLVAGFGGLTETLGLLKLIEDAGAAVLEGLGDLLARREVEDREEEGGVHHRAPEVHAVEETLEGERAVVIAPAGGGGRARQGEDEEGEEGLTHQTTLRARRREAISEASSGILASSSLRRRAASASSFFSAASSSASVAARASARICASRWAPSLRSASRWLPASARTASSLA